MAKDKTSPLRGRKRTFDDMEQSPEPDIKREKSDAAYRPIAQIKNSNLKTAAEKTAVLSDDPAEDLSEGPSTDSSDDSSDSDGDQLQIHVGAYEFKIQYNMMPQEVYNTIIQFATQTPPEQVRTIRDDALDPWIVGRVVQYLELGAYQVVNGYPFSKLIPRSSGGYHYVTDDVLSSEAKVRELYTRMSRAHQGDVSEFIKDAETDARTPVETDLMVYILTSKWMLRGLQAAALRRFTGGTRSDKLIYDFRFRAMIACIPAELWQKDSRLSNIAVLLALGARETLITSLMTDCATSKTLKDLIPDFRDRLLLEIYTEWAAEAKSTRSNV